jgi:hypothetical protein
MPAVPPVVRTANRRGTVRRVLEARLADPTRGTADDAVHEACSFIRCRRLRQALLQVRESRRPRSGASQITRRRMGGRASSRDTSGRVSWGRGRGPSVGASVGLIRSFTARGGRSWYRLDLGGDLRGDLLVDHGLTISTISTGVSGAFVMRMKCPMQAPTTGPVARTGVHASCMRPGSEDDPLQPRDASAARPTDSQIDVDGPQLLDGHPQQGGLLVRDVPKPPTWQSLGKLRDHPLFAIREISGEGISLRRPPTPMAGGLWCWETI